MAENNTNVTVSENGQKSDKYFNMSRMRRIIANIKNYIDTKLLEKAGVDEVEKMMEIEEVL